MAPVSLADTNVTLTEATHAGRLLIGNDLTADRTMTLPTPIAGMHFRFVGPDLASATEDGHDLIIAAGSGNTIFFQGQVTFLVSMVTLIQLLVQTETLTKLYKSMFQDIMT